MIAVTGANGQLGLLVIEALLRKMPAREIVAAVRSPEKAGKLAEKGVIVREADYDRPDTLRHAFDGVEKLLLISSSEVGKRVQQHKAVIAAAQAAGVELMAYTSVLHADGSPLALAEEHRQTEAALSACGIPFALLRNGWYTENYAMSIPGMLEQGALLGAAGDGLIASAARRDYAEAAAEVLTAGEDQSGRIYELAGDEPYTLSQFAAEVGRQAGREIAYRDLPEAEYKAVLVDVGVPEPFAALLADSDAGAARGALFDDSRQLSALIKRPTTPLAETVAAALKG